MTKTIENTPAADKPAATRGNSHHCAAAGKTVVDLTGILGLPPEMIDKLVGAYLAGHEIEIRNPSPEVLSLLRAVQIDSALITGSSTCT